MKHVVFDVDGVLIRNSETIFAQVLAAHHDIDTQSYVRDVLVGGKRITDGLPEAQRQEIFSHYRAALSQALRDANAWSEWSDALAHIHALPDVRLHLASGSPQDIGELILASTRWEPYFTTSLWSAHKSEPETYYGQLLASLSFDPHNDEVHLIEDSLHHAVAAATYATHRRLKSFHVYFVFNELYYKLGADFGDIVLSQLARHPQIHPCFAPEEALSAIFPLQLPHTIYCRYPINSAPTHSDQFQVGNMLYSQIYNVPSHLHFNHLDNASFDWAKQRSVFIIYGLLARGVNNKYDELLMQMTFSDGHVRWLLPGGSLRGQVGNDYMDAFIEKIHDKLLGENPCVRNLFPVGYCRNIFISEDGRVHVHNGLGWLGYMTCPRDRIDHLAKQIGRFENAFINVRQIQATRVPQAPNRHIVEDCLKSRVDFGYAEEGNLDPFWMAVHNRVVKRLLSRSNPHKTRIAELVREVHPCSFIDVSCGDDVGVLQYVEDSGVTYVVLNDINPELVQGIRTHIRSQRPRGASFVDMYTYQDVSNLVNLKSSLFDVVLCKNTLHHMQGLEQKERCIGELKRLSRGRIILMDVEFPQAEASRLKGARRRFVLWRHKYYMNALGEAGEDDTDTSFLSLADFERLVRRNFPAEQYSVAFETIPTLKANYMLAIIDRKKRP